jgi:predicted small lipoprotein YifL
MQRAMKRPAPILALCAILAGCGGDGTPVARTRPPAHYVAPLRRQPPPSAHVQQVPGVEGVIGAEAAALIRLFGHPRLDVWEGDARKLQFAGTPCVLDIYLYPPAAGKAPQATYVEARRASDAREVDRAACIAGLRKK